MMGKKIRMRVVTLCFPATVTESKKGAGKERKGEGETSEVSRKRQEKRRVADYYH